MGYRGKRKDNLRKNPFTYNPKYYSDGHIRTQTHQNPVGLEF